MGSQKNEVVIPVVKDELKVDAVPVETGGVRITKQVHSHDGLWSRNCGPGRSI